MIDLRSDTVTKPTPEMRRAMAEAEVGDDVYGEDPTVNRLQQRAAEIFGKEAALFVPTGTMGNTIGIKMQTNHGEEVICDARAHILDWEFSMTAWFSGCLVRTVETDNGILTWDRIAPKLRPDGPHCSPTTLLELENTHNMCGGVVYPQDVIDDVCDRAHAIGMKVHMDGARIFNASAAANTSVKRICEKVDSVNICLSKGLGAPVGSVLIGKQEDIKRGHRLRKRLGGGMRQVGVLAAAGLIALEQMPARLPEDHANARYLAQEGAKIPGIAIDPASVATNIVIYDVAGTGKSTAEISIALKDRGVLMNGIGGTRLRAVTHYDVSRAQCETAIAALREVCAS